MGVECGTLVEPPPGSGSCNISATSIFSDDIAAPHRPTRRSGMRHRYAARAAARAREFEQQLDQEFRVHEDPGNVARKQIEGLPWRLSMPGSAMRKRNWACPECAEECEPEWPKVIDELQAEVRKRRTDLPGSNSRRWTETCLGSVSRRGEPILQRGTQPLAGNPASGGEPRLWRATQPLAGNPASGEDPSLWRGIFVSTPLPRSDSWGPFVAARIRMRKDAPISFLIMKCHSGLS